MKLEDARAHVASLERSSHFREVGEAAELRILELQRDRQQVAVTRQTRNSGLLTVKAPIRHGGAGEYLAKNPMGHAQEGDQLWPGSPLLKLFDPTAMAVEVAVGEPDGAVLVPGARATVHLDAFPELTVTAHFESASPVATSPLGTSMKTFSARFVIDQTDPRLLPDLSAAVDIEVPVNQAATGGGSGEHIAVATRGKSRPPNDGQTMMGKPLRRAIRVAVILAILAAGDGLRQFRQTRASRVAAGNGQKRRFPGAGAVPRGTGRRADPSTWRRPLDAVGPSKSSGSLPRAARCRKDEVVIRFDPSRM